MVVKLIIGTVCSNSPQFIFPNSVIYIYILTTFLLLARAGSGKHLSVHGKMLKLEQATQGEVSLCILRSKYVTFTESGTLHGPALADIVSRWPEKPLALATW